MVILICLKLHDTLASQPPLFWITLQFRDGSPILTNGFSLRYILLRASIFIWESRDAQSASANAR